MNLDKMDVVTVPVETETMTVTPPGHPEYSGLLIVGDNEVTYVLVGHKDRRANSYVRGVQAV